MTGNIECVFTSKLMGLAMTAQELHKVHLQGNEYDLIGVKGGTLPTPQDFGIQPVMWHTACYRGYIATYNCDGKTLVLQEFFIGRIAEDSEWLPINGIEPESVHVDRVVDERKYRDLNIIPKYSGKVLLGKDSVGALNWPTAYAVVKELVVDEGYVVRVNDLSEKGMQIRLMLQERFRHSRAGTKIRMKAETELIQEILDYDMVKDCRITFI